jgi:copper chaperone
MKKNSNTVTKPVQHSAKIKIDNLKCGGCATSIEMGLLAIDGVTKAHVMEETGEVEIFYDEGFDLLLAKNKLKHLGYPETGTTEGLERVTTNVKSYVSCAIGKLKKNNDKNKS